MNPGPTTDTPFAYRCSVDVFPLDERAALDTLGPHLEALAAGAVPPATPAEEHFLKVDREEENPETVAERAWVRLKGRREFEAEQQAAAPPPPPDNYGMVEFDADRCWW